MIKAPKRQKVTGEYIWQPYIQWNLRSLKVNQQIDVSAKVSDFMGREKNWHMATAEKAIQRKGTVETLIYVPYIIAHSAVGSTIEKQYK